MLAPPGCGGAAPPCYKAKLAKDQPKLAKSLDLTVEATAALPQRALGRAVGLDVVIVDMLIEVVGERREV